MTACMKLKEMGVRLPDALLVVYPSTNVSTAACPSRIISVVDPILPLGVLVACQQVKMIGTTALRLALVSIAELCSVAW